MLLAANVWEDNDLVWYQPNGRPIDGRADWQEWSDILTEAGIAHVGVHAMRHSAATIAIDEGIALTVVQEQLGHADIRTTRGYVHELPASGGRCGARRAEAFRAYCYENCYEATMNVIAIPAFPLFRL